MTSFAALFAAHAWRPIPGCPGRWSLAPTEVSPAALAGGAAVEAIGRVSSARDLVHAVHLEGGGLISYERPDGRFVHTLGDESGFARKLADLTR